MRIVSLGASRISLKCRGISKVVLKDLSREYRRLSEQEYEDMELEELDREVTANYREGQASFGIIARELGRFIDREALHERMFRQAAEECWDGEPESAGGRCLLLWTSREA